jgi:hypothetical protein
MQHGNCVCESCSDKLQSYSAQFDHGPRTSTSTSTSHSGSGISSLSQWEVLRSYIRHMYIQSSAQKDAGGRPDYRKVVP